MENRLKERLTGAAILVALIVLIVPEMFRGPPPPAGVRGAPAAGEGPPVRSYTIDLNANGTPATPPRLSGPPQGPAATSPAAAGTALAPVAPAAVAAGQGLVAGPGTTGRRTGAGSGTPGWSVQLGLFSKADNATRLAHAAHGKGFTVRVSRSARGLYRVALGGLADRAAALQAARRLRAAGLPAAVVGPR
jgi:DedD protein